MERLHRTRHLENARRTKIATPFGPIDAVATDDALLILQWGYQTNVAIPVGMNEILKRAEKQLTEYFAGKRREFDIPVAFEGTEFQKRVWNELLKIPFGKHITYGAQAAKIGRPKAVRAVGATNGKNPIAIVVPCHRVIGASGALTGYAGGIEIKRALLEIEGISISG